MSIPVSATVLADYRQKFERGFTSRVYVLRAGPNDKVSDGGGGTVSTPRTVANYPCRLQTMRRPPQERVQAGAVKSITPYEALLPFDADVLDTDRLRVQGQTFEVLGSDKGKSEALCLTVQLKLVG